MYFNKEVFKDDYIIRPTAGFELGLDLHTIGNNPSGTNINQNCGSLFPYKASDLVKKKGGLKPKRLIAMCKAMMTNKHHLKLIEKVQNNKDDKLKAEVVGLSDLKEGENPGTIVPLTFLVPISGQGKIPPVLLIMADKDQNCVCLAMYKVGYDRLDFFNSKHVYHVMHPVYKTIELELGGEAGKVTFPCIQLDHPRSLARDGTRLSDFYSHEFTTNQMKG